VQWARKDINQLQALLTTFGQRASLHFTANPSKSAKTRKLGDPKYCVCANFHDGVQTASQSWMLNSKIAPATLLEASNICHIRANMPLAQGCVCLAQSPGHYRAPGATSLALPIGFHVVQDPCACLGLADLRRTIG